MDQVPDFWRAVVFHPLSVHFPIALLLFSTFAYAVAVFLKEENRNRWLFMAQILLIAGVIGGWISIYTGNVADGEVSRTICDPPALKDHEITAYTATIIFSCSLGILILKKIFFASAITNLFTYFVLLLLLTGSGFLMYAGHLGATLVYQQAAGVYHPSENCQEFE